MGAAVVGVLAVAGAGCFGGSERAEDPPGPSGPPRSAQVDDPAPFVASEWTATAVLGSGGGATGLYYLGGHRVAADGRTYEATSHSFRVELDGSVTEIAAPPVERGIGSAVGVAVHDALVVFLRDCDPAGDPSSGGFACARGTEELRLLRYDPPADRWEALDVPAELMELASGPAVQLVPGIAADGGRLFVAVPARAIGGVDQIAAFDLDTGRWSLLLDEPGQLAGCTDGTSLFYVDRRQILSGMGDRSTDVVAGSDAVTVPVDLHVVDPSGGGEQLEAFTHHDVPSSAALGIQLGCMADGSVLVMPSLTVAGSHQPWSLRLADGTWTTVEVDGLFNGPRPWQMISLPNHVVIYASESTGADQPLVGRSFALDARSWSALPDLPGSSTPHRMIAAGADHLAMVPNDLTLADVPTFVEVE